MREWFGDLSVTEAAQRLDVSRVTLLRILNGATGVSADMALRLHEGLGTSAEMWMGLQAAYDLWKAEIVKRTKIKPIFKDHRV